MLHPHSRASKLLISVFRDIFCLWGERLRTLLTPEDWARRSALCDPASPGNILRSADYYCVYPITVFTARVPG